MKDSFSPIFFCYEPLDFKWLCEGIEKFQASINLALIVVHHLTGFSAAILGLGTATQLTFRCTFPKESEVWLLAHAILTEYVLIFLNQSLA